MHTGLYLSNGKKLERLRPKLRGLPNALKLKVAGYMDLNVDVLERKKMQLVIAPSHYYKHSSGDMIADPASMRSARDKIRGDGLSKGNRRWRYCPRPNAISIFKNAVQMIKAENERSCFDPI